MKKRLLGLVLILTVLMGISVFAKTEKNPNTNTKSNVVKANNEKVDKETGENESKDEDNITTKVNLSKSEAKKIVLKDYQSGNTQIGEVELEDEDGTIVYGIEVSVASQKYDVKVNANTGKIIKTEADNDKSENSND